MILIVVYVGAVAVLFLFVVMLLDVDFAELKQGFVQYLPIGGLIALCVAAELGYAAVALDALADRRRRGDAVGHDLQHRRARARALHPLFLSSSRPPA